MIIELLDSEFKWLDTGTFDALHESSDFIMNAQKNSNIKIGLLDEIAFLKGYIDKQQLKKNVKKLSSDLGKLFNR